VGPRISLPETNVDRGQWRSRDKMQISVKIPVSKACTLDRIGRKWSKSLLSPHVFGARGSIFRRRLGWSRRSEPVSMSLMSSPCAAALRCFVWMWLSSLQGRSDQQAQLQNSKGRLTNPVPREGPPRLAPRSHIPERTFSFPPPC
jgi:hypothetical protein